MLKFINHGHRLVDGFLKKKPAPVSIPAMARNQWAQLQGSTRPALPAHRSHRCCIWTRRTCTRCRCKSCRGSWRTLGCTPSRWTSSRRPQELLHLQLLGRGWVWARLGFVDGSLGPGLETQHVAVKYLDSEGVQGHREWLVRCLYPTLCLRFLPTRLCFVQAEAVYHHLSVATGSRGRWIAARHAVRARERSVEERDYGGKRAPTPSCSFRTWVREVVEQLQCRSAFSGSGLLYRSCWRQRNMHWIRMWGLSDEEVCLFVLFVPWCGGFAARVSRGSLWTRSFFKW
jgi:hypothetical protein